MDDLILSGGGGGGGGSAGQSQNQQQAQEEQLKLQREKQEDFKNQVLGQILDQQARGRLSTLSIAKPEKAAAVENILINMARMGRLGGGGKVTETQLIDLLEKVGGSSNNMMGSGGGAGGNGSSGVNFSRRRVNLDDEDDEDEYNKIMEDL